MAYNPTKKMDVTGPVQPNDIVMRASEIGQSMPGIGALAYKQARKGAQKGIKGIHMIPDTTNQNMDFMGIAKQNVNSQLTNMANTVEAASAPPGHMLAFITPEEAGILRLLGGTGEMTSAGIPAFKKDPAQVNRGPEVSGIPRYFGKGEHKVNLAYITEPEAQLLKNLDLHDSNPPHTGPSIKNIPNYNDFGGGGYTGSTGEGAGGGSVGGHGAGQQHGGQAGEAEGAANAGNQGNQNQDNQGGTYDNLTEAQIKDRLRNPNRFSPEDVQNAINQANEEGLNTSDAFGNKLGNIGNETTKSLAVRDMMMNAAGYNPNAKGYDNPFNVGMDLDLGYKTYDRMLNKGYTPQQIAKMNFTQTKGLLGDMKFNATLDGEPVGSFNMNKPGGFLDNIFGSGGFTFARDYASQGNRGGNRDRNFVDQMIEEEGGGGGSSGGEESNYLDADEYYLPEDYTSFRITEGDRVPGRRRFLLRKDGTKLPEGESYSIEDILDYAMSGGYNLLEPFSEYQSRRREYYGDPDFGQGTEFDYSGSTSGGGTP
jgi:hypothetical protein